jgi:hypothetical protein
MNDEILKDLFEDKVRLLRHASFTRKDVERLVPHGQYCYDNNGTCIFWSRWMEHDEQNSGYCSLMEKGDFMSSENGGTMLLWDQCKECGINDEIVEGDLLEPTDTPKNVIKFD